MPNRCVEETPLLPISNHSKPLTFFQKIKNKPTYALKKIALATASAFSGYMYWPSSFNAAALGGQPLQVTAALGGSTTNAIFNYESFLSLSELPKFRSMPWKYLTATLFSVACVAPNFFMDIVDEDGNYMDTTHITLQASTTFLNIWVNVVGSLELINSLSTLVKNKTTLEKEKLIEKIDGDIKRFSQLSADEQTRNELIRLFEINNTLSLRQKITYYSLNTSVGLLSIPQFLAYVFISYFGMKDLSEKKIGANQTVSTLLACIAAIGNAIPNAGFSMKGIDSSCKKIISLEKPSLLAILFILPALFSGFTSHKAMADSLKELEYSGNIAELLNWLSNFGAALIYNLPQMLALANRLGKETSADTDEFNTSLNTLQRDLKDKINSLENSSTIIDFENNLISEPLIINFFSKPHHKNDNPSYNSDSGSSDYQSIPLLHVTVNR